MSAHRVVIDRVPVRHTPGQQEHAGDDYRATCDTCGWCGAVRYDKRAAELDAAAHTLAHIKRGNMQLPADVQQRITEVESTGLPLADVLRELHRLADRAMRSTNGTTSAAALTAVLDEFYRLRRVRAAATTNGGG